MMVENRVRRNILAVFLTVAAMMITGYALGSKYPGQVVLPLLKALLLAIAIFIDGFFLAMVFKKKSHPDSPLREIDLPTAVALGLVFTTFLFFLLGFLQWVSPAVIMGFYVLPLVLLAAILFNPGHRSLLKKSLGNFFQRPALEYPLFFLPFIFASLPPSFYDSLVYHLGIPNLYLVHQGFIETPHFFFANTSVYYEVSLIPAVFAGDRVPSLFHFILGMIFILSTIDFARERFRLDTQERTILVILLLSMPLCLFLLSTVKSDLPGAFLVFLGIRYMLINRWGLSALFWGFSLGVKYFNALPFLVFLGLFLVMKHPTMKKNQAKGVILKKIAGMFLVMLVMITPLLLKNYHYAGNPFFPFLTQIEPFKNPNFDSSRLSHMQADVGKMFHSSSDILKFPYTLSFSPLGFGGMVGAQFLIFLPFLLVMRVQMKRQWLMRLVLVFSILTLYAAGFFTVSIRFVFIAVVFLAMAVVLVYRWLPGKVKWLRFLFWFVVGVNLVMGLAFQEQLVRSHRLLMSEGDAESYKASMFPTYPAIHFVNQQAGHGSRVLLVGEARNYYLKIPYEVATGIDYPVIKKYLQNSTSLESFIAAIKADHFNWMIINRGELSRLQQGYDGLTRQEWQQINGYWERLQEKALFRQQGIWVIKL